MISLYSLQSKIWGHLLNGERNSLLCIWIMLHMLLENHRFVLLLYFSSKLPMYLLFKYQDSIWLISHWTFYSATSFLEKCKKLVPEKWFFKLGFFFWSTTFLQPEKMWIYIIKPPFFLVNHFSRTRFLEPDFSNHFSRTTFLQLSRKVVAE